MDAIILAAGSGRRLGTGRPKCLTPIGGRRLIDHQLDALAAAGVQRPLVVVGYKRDEVCAALAGRARVVVNEDYATTNSMYSFLLAREEVRGPTFVLNADVLFDPQVALALAARTGSALACDSTSGDEDEHMKVQIRRGRLRRMSKSLAPHHCSGENLGLLCLDAVAAREAFLAAQDLVDRGAHNAWLGEAINAVALSESIECVDVAGTPWVEIDFPEDLAHARRHVWPAIARSTQRRRARARGWEIALAAREGAAA
jgi:choline kinase